MQIIKVFIPLILVLVWTPALAAQRNQQPDAGSSPPVKRSVRLNGYHILGMGSSSDSPDILTSRLEMWAKRDLVVYSEGAEWVNDVSGWPKLTPQSLKKLNPNIEVYRYWTLMAKAEWEPDWHYSKAENNRNDQDHKKRWLRWNCPLNKATIDKYDWWLRDGSGEVVKETSTIRLLDVGKPGFKEAYVYGKMPDGSVDLKQGLVNRTRDKGLMGYSSTTGGRT
jgi:hypothetical protein